jgi:hypothetical protein
VNLCCFERLWVEEGSWQLLTNKSQNITKCYTGFWTLWVVVNITMGKYGLLQNFSRTGSLTSRSLAECEETPENRGES